MTIVFPKKPTDQIIEDLDNVINNRGLADNVQIDHQDGKLVVKVSKLGVSTLIFSRTNGRKHAQFSLTSEEIAFSHRMSRSQFEEQLRSIVEEAGGEIAED